MEMTRWGLGPLKEETGIGTVEVANRMADYGIDPYWMSHEPWVVPEPFTPEAGEMYGKEDIDAWIDASPPSSRRPMPIRRSSATRRTSSPSRNSTAAGSPSRRIGPPRGALSGGSTPARPEPPGAGPRQTCIHEVRY